MNREILFRGMISMGDMMEGSLLINGDKTTIMDRGLVFGYGVDPKTVGQYTGLKDKNGAKIFEGDIMNGEDDSELGYVVFDDGRFIVQRPWGPTNIKEYLENNKTRAVIGNIHQNPELL